MLSISGQTLALWLHVVAPCIWIGGQVTVAAVIPLLRGQGEMARLAGRRYQAVAWPAFAVLIVTGNLNVGNAGLQWSQLLDSPAGRTLAVKLGLVALSGLAAGVHSFLQAPRRGDATTGRPVASALLGSISLLAALLAALYGVAIAGAWPRGRQGREARAERRHSAWATRRGWRRCRAEALDRLQRHGFVGRVAVVVDGRLMILPVNYLADRDALVVCTAEGTKLSSLRDGAAVTFEVDDSRPLYHSGWSVVVEGTASEITDAKELESLRRVR